MMNTKDKILIVEDELSLRETLAYNLRNQGYQVKVAADGETALNLARSFAPDLILLDIMLPVLDGLEVCRILRQETEAAILILTARDDDVDRIIGLEIGADDYITKPFNMRELIARIKAHLRRTRMIKASGQKGKTTVLVFGNLHINPERREVKINDSKLFLKPKEYDLLLFLAQNQGKVLSRSLILEKVWGWEFSGGTRTLDVHIRWLRQKIEPDPAHPKRIITIRSIGYQFEG